MIPALRSLPLLAIVLASATAPVDGLASLRA